MNGIGVVREGENFFQGNYVNGKLEGMAMLYRTEEKRIIYCETKNGVIMGQAIICNFDGSIVMTTMKPEKEGQSITRTADLKYKGNLYKNNTIVESY